MDILSDLVAPQKRLRIESDILPPSVERRRTLSLAEQIAEQIGKAILEEHYKPGQALTEQSLSSEFSVSRGPVREALRILEREKLVEIVPRHGARVTHLSTREVSEIFDIRAVLLGHAARLAAESRDEQFLRVLERGHAMLAENVAGDNDLDVHFDVSAQMNYALVAQTGNQKLFEIVFNLARQIARYTRLGLSSAEQRKTSVESWQELIEHIRAGRADAAEAIERDRVQRTQSYAMQLLEEIKA